MIAPASRPVPARVDDPGQREVAQGVPRRPNDRTAASKAAPTPGRSLVSRRAVTDIVRAATLGSYGVTGFAGGWLGRLAGRAGLPPRGLRIGLREELTIDLDLTVAHGLPVAEVARQVDSAVRYAIRRSLDREVDRLTIHVEGLRSGPPQAASRGSHGPGPRPVEAIGPDELAASGTDVA